MVVSKKRGIHRKAGVGRKLSKRRTNRMSTIKKSKKNRLNLNVF